MRVAFESSHVQREPAPLLTVTVTAEDPAAQATSYDTLIFSTPLDYHVHNDLVAAALLTLVGRKAQVVTFNFPISEHCATTLSDYYALDEVGPVDPSLAPRQPGRNLGLNFSGGTDSTAVWLLLTRAGLDFKTITSNYGGRFYYERVGYERFQRDITCATNFRVNGYERNLGRFNGAAPLLFADYLDLYGIATGHNMYQNPLDIGPVLPDRPPAFRKLEAAFTAGGLAEVHLIRSLTMIGTLTILLQGGTELVEAAFAASSHPTNWKYFSKALLAQWICKQRGFELPAFLRDLTPPTHGSQRDDDLSWAVFAAVLHQRGELALPEALVEVIADFPPELGKTFSMEYCGKYHPDYAALLPTPLRNPVLNQFHEFGIYPYGERDWREIVAARALVCGHTFTDNEVMAEMCV